MVPCLGSRRRPHCIYFAPRGESRCFECRRDNARDKEADATRRAKKAAKAPAYKHPDYTSMKRHLERFPGICHLCGLPGATSPDHVVPLSRGGAWDRTNLRPSHKSCNFAKGARTE
jgi:5-methylcytosine-specific restriction endonuclease McrA